MSEARPTVAGSEALVAKWPASSLTALGISDFDGGADDGRHAARVLFAPSFHAEVCITASDRSSPHVVLVTTQASRWLWDIYERDSRDGAWPPQKPAPMRPERWKERADVAAERWQAFWAELASTDPLALTDTDAHGLDGMTVRAEYHDGSALGGFRHWFDGQHDRHGRFVMAVFRLAGDLLTDERSVRAMEQLHAYLRLGLPLKDLPGPPRTFRLFGPLSSGHERPLQQAFDRLHPDEPVLMDLSNFESMGGILMPIFQAFIARPGPTAWWGSSRHRQTMVFLGATATWVFETREAAVAALMRGPC